jgi:O-antigen/teichoic acid export membrane protein
MMSTTAQQRAPSLAKQAAWLLIAKIAGFALAFIAPLLIVRVLDQREFGLYKQAFLIVANAPPLLTLAFYMNVFYFLPRRPEQAQKVVLNVLIVHLAIGLLSLGVMLGYPQLLARLFGSDDLLPYARLLGIVLSLWIFGYFLEVVATASQDVKFSTAFIVGSQLTRSIALCSAAVLFGTLDSLLYAAVVQGAVQSVVLLWYLQRRYPGFIGRPDWMLMGEQLRYAVPLGIAAAAAIVQSDLHMYFVANRFSAAEYAIYAVGCFQLPLLGMLRESINAVLIPRISLLQQNGQRREIVVLLVAAMRKLGFVYLPVFAFLSIMAAEFLEILFTNRYAASTPVFLINLLAVPTLILISDPVTRAYTEHMGYLLKARLIAAVLMAPAVLFGIQYFGMRGALLAAVSIIIVERVVVMLKVLRILAITRKDSVLFADIPKLALAALCAAAATAGVRHFAAGNPVVLVLAFAAVVFSAVYLAVVVLLRVPTAQETDFVRGRFMQVGRMLRLA